jgi:hypothetical protein
MGINILDADASIIVNVGRYLASTSGWPNSDNSFNLRIARWPILPALLGRTCGLACPVGSLAEPGRHDLSERAADKVNGETIRTR